MEIAHFERAAAAAAPFIAEPDLSVGQRILRATEASFGATGLNTNLGIILLCVPLAKAASETNAGMGLRRRLAVILSMLDKQDAADAFAAIRIANPAGLGEAERGDVRTSGPDLTLIEAMHLASGRDRIANAYVTAYEDVFDFALPALTEARSKAARDDLAITKAIIQMAHSLKLETVAEGVETQAQLDTLQSLGCDNFQGYLISRPLDARGVRAFIAP